jgi:nitroreductase
MNDQLFPEVSSHRSTGYDVNPLIMNRWSPRSFLDRDIPEEVLFSLFEAARWAPSASNEQPWRFIIARSQEERETFYSFIAEGNRLWCEKAPVLAVIISKSLTSNGKPNRAHAFDTGTAWGYLALEAIRKGLMTHAMGGFDREQARKTLNVPEEFELHAVIAIGYRGNTESLPPELQEREKPSVRRPLSDSMFSGRFGER